MNKKKPGVTVLRTILIIPWLLPDVVVALLYKWIFNANYGVFNTILIRLGILQKNQAWLSTGSAFVILAIVCIWKGYALIMVNVMAGLQSVPEDIYEAAKLDGAKPVQTFFKITLPLSLIHILDQAFLIFAMENPKPNFLLLDRFLIMMEQQGIPVVICFNKKDVGCLLYTS